MWAGLADGTLDLVATDHVADRVAVEKAEAADGVAVRPDLERRARHRDAPGDGLREGVAKGRTHDRADGRRPVDDAGRGCSGSSGKGAIEVGRDADLVLFDPAARRTIRAADLHHTSDYTPYEGLEVTGAVRVRLRARPRPSSGDGAFVGRARLRAVRRARSTFRMMLAGDIKQSLGRRR